MNSFVPPTLDEFLETCRREIAYLCDEFGFHEAGTRRYNRFSVCYRRGDMGIDVYGEGWGEGASCELVSGDLRSNYHRLLPPRELPESKRRKEPDQLAQIATIAAELRSHGRDFLEGDLRRFDEIQRRTRAEQERRSALDNEAARLQRTLDTEGAAAGHAFKRGEFALVVKALEPLEGKLSRHLSAMLESARRRVADDRLGPDRKPLTIAFNPSGDILNSTGSLATRNGTAGLSSRFLRSVPRSPRDKL